MSISNTCTIENMNREQNILVKWHRRHMQSITDFWRMALFQFLSHIKYTNNSKGKKSYENRWCDNKMKLSKAKDPHYYVTEIYSEI